MLQHFVGGLQQGLNFGQDFRRNRQLERAIDFELGELDEQQWGRRGEINASLGRAGRPEQSFYSGLPDPFGKRILDWFRGRRANRQQQPMGQDMGYDRMQHDSMGIPLKFRDGGNVDRDEAVRRAQESRARTSERGGSTTERVQGRDEFAEREKAQQSRAQAKPSLAQRGAGLARRGLNAAGRVAALPALLATGFQTATTDTEDYRKRFGLEPGSADDGFLEDAGVRALGAASDLGNALTLGFAGRFYRDKQGDEAPAEAPAPAPTEAPPTQALPVASPGAGRAAPAAESTAPPPAALPTPQEEEPFDWSGVMPAEVPSMGTDEWAQYRREVVPYLVAQGMTESEAHLEVTKVQQQGFLRHAQEAQALLGANDMHGAAAALRAAYQYFPNGADVQFGVQGNALIGIGIDEQTKQQLGRPMILNEERLAAMIDNFSNPGAFLAWTKDWRDEQFARQKYAEVERPQAESENVYRDRTGRAALMNAQADQIRASFGGSRPDIEGAQRVFRERVEMLGLDDEATADMLASVMAQVRARVPDETRLPTNKIIDDIMKAYREGRLEQVMATLGLQ